MSIKHSTQYLNNIYNSIIQDYINNIPVYKMSKKYRIDHRTIAKILKDNGIPNRGNSVARRRCDLNESFFQNIDSREKAYFLGLIYTDGYVGTIENTLGLALQEEDGYILKSLSFLMRGKDTTFLSKKRKSNYQNQIKLVISNAKIKQDLMLLGVIPNKSLILEWPKIDDTFISDFIRGVFDGDGSITFGTRANNNIYRSFSIVGAKSFIETLSNKINYYLDIPIYIDIIKKNNLLASCRTSKLDSLNKIYNFIYKDNPEYYLSRKRLNFEKSLKLCRH